MRYDDQRNDGEDRHHALPRRLVDLDRKFGAAHSHDRGGGAHAHRLRRALHHPAGTHRERAALERCIELPVVGGAVEGERSIASVLSGWRRAGGGRYATVPSAPVTRTSACLTSCRRGWEALPVTLCTATLFLICPTSVMTAPNAAPQDDQPTHRNLTPGPRMADS
jgi:hypothetical protein